MGDKKQMDLYDGASPVSDSVDVTKNKHRGNPESEAANLAAAHSKSKFRKMIFDWFLGNGPAIAEDCLEAFPHCRYSTVTARISELRRDGMLIKIGTRATRYSGKEAALLSPRRSK
jgi:hypothetical protein